MSFDPKGIYCAIVTPLTADDKFDERAFRRIIDFQIDAGIAGLLVIGGSGEFVSLTPPERRQVVEAAVDHVKGRVPVVVGALAPGTREVQDVAHHASQVGADAVLVLPPYYIKPSPPGIVEHFARVADVSSLPIVAYNNTGRTGINLDVRLLEKLAAIPSIIALKECERDLAVVSTKINALKGRISVLSGDDDLGFPTFLLGSPGGIFMTANLIPQVHVAIFNAVAKGDIDGARRAHYSMLPLVEALYTADHPGPLKTAMEFIGYPVGKARPPLQPGSTEAIERAKKELLQLGALR